jgi:hypothetical protein
VRAIERGEGTPETLDGRLKIWHCTVVRVLTVEIIKGVYPEGCWITMSPPDCPVIVIENGAGNKKGFVRGSPVIKI